MKKIFLIFTLFVSSYVLAEIRTGDAKWLPTKTGQDYKEGEVYQVCSSFVLNSVVACSNSYLKKGFKAQSGLHATQALYGDGSQGTYFFQAFIKK